MSAGPEIDVERLISAVGEHPEIWDTACDRYKDKGKKASAWVVVSRVVYPDYDTWSEKEQHIQTQEAMNKWRTVRDNYMRVQKKQAMAARSGAGAKKVRGYIYAEQLSFLRRTQEPRRSVSSMDQPSTSGTQAQQMVPGDSASCQEEENQGGAESQMEEDLATPQVAGTATTASTRPGQKRRAQAADLEQAMVMFMEAQTTHAHQRCMLADSVDMSFSNACTLLLNRMSEAEKMEYRHRSLGILEDILSRPHHAAAYHAVPQSASGSSVSSEVLSTHPAMPPGARPHTESGSSCSHTTGPHDPDAPRYQQL